MGLRKFSRQTYRVAEIQSNMEEISKIDKHTNSTEIKMKRDVKKMKKK